MFETGLYRTPPVEGQEHSNNGRERHMSITTPLTDMELVHGVREGDERMREQLIMRHTPLVRSIARRYVGRGLALDDIVQAGNLGLVQSVNRYRPERGVPLSAFAARTIEGEIMHQFRDRGWAV